MADQRRPLSGCPGLLLTDNPPGLQPHGCSVQRPATAGTARRRCPRQWRVVAAFWLRSSTSPQCVRLWVRPRAALVCGSSATRPAPPGAPVRAVDRRRRACFLLGLAHARLHRASSARSGAAQHPHAAPPTRVPVAGPFMRRCKGLDCRHHVQREVQRAAPLAPLRLLPVPVL